MAVGLVRSAEKVQAEMGCPSRTFEQYRHGQAEPTYHELDRLIQLIIREQGKAIAANRARLARLRRDES